ncbi:hypothetical protein E0E50_19675 [Azotobacter chroococcum subsp. isscasi]|nr:hypothetical protein E0E50_19675 [Azotobacter chroococcum subsp. isscasi]
MPGGLGQYAGGVDVSVGTSKRQGSFHMNKLSALKGLFDCFWDGMENMDDYIRFGVSGWTKSSMESPSLEYLKILIGEVLSPFYSRLWWI